MKLDKIRFAALVAFIQIKSRNLLEAEDMRDLDALIDVDVPLADPYCAPAAHDINNLMALMAAGTYKIEAIKLHRKLTGWGLKESKEEVEKYWKSGPVASKAIETGPNPSYVPPSPYPANQTFG